METIEITVTQEILQLLSLSRDNIGKFLNIEIKEPDSRSGLIKSWEVTHIEEVNNIYLIQREFACSEKKARKIMEGCIRIYAKHKGPVRTDIGSDAGKRVHLVYELTGFYVPKRKSDVLYVKTKIKREPVTESV